MTKRKGKDKAATAAAAPAVTTPTGPSFIEQTLVDNTGTQSSALSGSSERIRKPIAAAITTSNDMSVLPAMNRGSGYPGNAGVSSTSSSPIYSSPSSPAGGAILVSPKGSLGGTSPVTNMNVSPIRSASSSTGGTQASTSSPTNKEGSIDTSNLGSGRLKKEKPPGLGANLTGLIPALSPTLSSPRRKTQFQGQNAASPAREQSRYLISPRVSLKNPEAVLNQEGSVQSIQQQQSSRSQNQSPARPSQTTANAAVATPKGKLFVSPISLSSAASASCDCAQISPEPCVQPEFTLKQSKTSRSRSKSSKKDHAPPALVLSPRQEDSKKFFHALSSPRDSPSIHSPKSPRSARSPRALNPLHALSMLSPRSPRSPRFKATKNASDTKDNQLADGAAGDDDELGFVKSQHVNAGPDSNAMMDEQFNVRSLYSKWKDGRKKKAELGGHPNASAMPPLNPANSNNANINATSGMFASADFEGGYDEPISGILFTGERLRISDRLAARLAPHMGGAGGASNMADISYHSTASNSTAGGAKAHLDAGMSSKTLGSVNSGVTIATAATSNSSHSNTTSPKNQDSSGTRHQHTRRLAQFIKSLADFKNHVTRAEEAGGQFVAGKETHKSEIPLSELDAGTNYGDVSRQDSLFEEMDDHFSIADSNNSFQPTIEERELWKEIVKASEDKVEVNIRPMDQLASEFQMIDLLDRLEASGFVNKDGNLQYRALMKAPAKPRNRRKLEEEKFEVAKRFSAMLDYLEMEQPDSSGLLAKVDLHLAHNLHSSKDTAESMPRMPSVDMHGDQNSHEAACMEAAVASNGSGSEFDIESKSMTHPPVAGSGPSGPSGPSAPLGPSGPSGHSNDGSYENP